MKQHLQIILLKRLIFTLVILAGMSLSAEVAAQATVTGKVTSEEDGSNLIGVTILVKGTQNGTVTDLDGTYSIDV